MKLENPLNGSYSLPEEGAEEFKEVTMNWDFFIDAVKKEIAQNHPEDDFSKGTLKIKNRIFTKRVRITGEIEHGISFENCFFRSDVDFTDLDFKGELSFRQCFCDRNIYLAESVKFEKPFDLIDFSIKGQLYVKGGDYELCNWNVLDNCSVTIAGGVFKRELNFGYWGGGSKIKDLTIDLNHRLSGLIRITGEKTEIHDLSIFKSAQDVSISLEDINVNYLMINRYRNDKNFRISNLKAMKTETPSEICILLSYLGKAEFYNIDFSKYDKLNILTSNLIESSFVNVQWKDKITSFIGRGIAIPEGEELLPQKIKLVEKRKLIPNAKLRNDPQVQNYYRLNKEVYRQLKHVYEKQGDVIKSHHFLSRELKSYIKTHNTNTAWGTHLIIRFSYIFSNFGSSLFRPLVALMAGHFLILNFLICLGQIQPLELTWDRATVDGFRLAFEKYFFYINPLHKSGEEFKGFYSIFDVVMRIWSSFMIYNIIRATRRFIK